MSQLWLIYPCFVLFLVSTSGLSAKEKSLIKVPKNWDEATYGKKPVIPIPVKPRPIPYVRNWDQGAGATENDIYLANRFKHPAVQSVPKVTFPYYRRYPPLEKFNKIKGLIRRRKLAEAQRYIKTTYIFEQAYDCLAYIEFSRLFFAVGAFDQTRYYLTYVMEATACQKRYKPIAQKIWIAIFGEGIN